MLSWLATAWRALLALLAFRQGVSTGKADQQQQDIAKNDQVAQAVQRAVDRVPPADDADALQRRLRDGPGI